MEIDLCPPQKKMKIDGMEANNSAAANDGTAAGASSTHASMEGQEIDTSAGFDYEVFLSFRGPDTRSGFTDFLYTRLVNAGIRTFKDDEDLRVGEEFAPKLTKAINESKISIPILSKGYASSVWCLKELVQMVKCQQKGTQQIKPIFYDVAPSEVRSPRGVYAEAFEEHKKKGRHDENTLREWRNALKAVGNLNGWELHSEGNRRREGAFAERVTKEVFNDLKKAYLVVTDCFVDVDDDIKKINDMISVETSETRIIGIHGMGGIGKTTIAKKIYNELLNNFDHCCFLSNIREMSERRGIEYLQHQLVRTVLKVELPDIKNKDDGILTIQERLHTKKVLLLLDDVDHKDHMDALVGKRNWFGKGSRLIITTRNKEILKVPEVDKFHEVNVMDHHQSLQLFCKHAFRRDSPRDKDIDQSIRAIDIAGGLPLALEIIGSLLGRTEREEWDVRLEKLESVPHNDVQRKLKISYDALDDLQQYIFLDIACLFIGYDKDILICYWDALSFFPKEAMKVLQNLSLIKIDEDNEVWMHDQLRDLGRNIVYKKSDRKRDQQRRVWNLKEGLDLLRRPKGKKEVEALRLNLDHQQQCLFTYEGFENVSDLRFLEVGGWMKNLRVEDRLLWHESALDMVATNENSDLLPVLRWLSWHDIPPTLNVTNFSMKEVVILDLSNSKITDDWNGWNYMEALRNLKSLNLSKCQNFRRLPDTLGNLTSLIELDISHTGIEELPDSIGNLKNLKVVKMGGIYTTKIPHTFWTIEKFEEIEVHRCGDVRIGDGIYRNQSLRILRLTGVSIYALPPRLPESLIQLKLLTLHTDMFPDLSNLNNLKELYLMFSRPDNKSEPYGIAGDPMPRWIGNLSKLESLELVFYCETSPATDSSLPPRLKSLRLFCRNLRCLPKLPSSLSSLILSDCFSLCSMEDVSNLKNLSSLIMWGPEITEIRGLGCLENLRRLELSRLRQLQILPDLSNLNILRSLQVRQCDNLVEIQGELPRCLDRLRIFSCPSLQKLPDLSSMVGKQQAKITACRKLNVEVILEYARKNQRRLKLVGFDQLRILPDLSKSNELRRLKVSSCHNLVEFQGELPQSLERLEISSCESLQKLPLLSNLKKLRSVKISGCGKLNVEAILRFARQNPQDLKLSNLDESRRLRVDNRSNLVEVQADVPESLEKLHISFSEALCKLPDLSSLMGLREVRISSCANLVEIEGELPESLEILTISSCGSLLKLPDLSCLKKLQRVKIVDCTKLEGEAILGSSRRRQVNLWENLQYLRICGLGQLEILVDLSNSSKLRHLCVEKCSNLLEIQGKLPESLKKLDILSCKSLQKLPNPSSLKGLRRLRIDRCEKLNVEVNSWLCSEKLVKFVLEYRESEFNSECESEREDEE